MANETKPGCPSDENRKSIILQLQHCGIQINGMKRNFFLSFFMFPLAISLAGQDFTTANHDTIILDNGFLVREIRVDEEGLTSVRLSMKDERRSYIEPSREFSFLLNGVMVDGQSGWRVSGKETIRDEHAGEGIRLMLDGQGDRGRLQLGVSYLLYPGLPLVRKWLTFTNAGTEELVVEGVSVEDLQTVFSHIHTMVLHNYGRMEHLGRFTGNWYDPVVVLHHQSQRRGIAAGNEAPGVLKRTAYHTVSSNLEVGLTQPNQDFPFRKYLAPGETWETPRTFICLYRDRDDGFAVIDREVNDFVRRHMVPRIIRNEEKPLFVYNTWNPFRTFVSDSLVREVAAAAAGCGVGEFIIDGGW
jgi:alpha-galactosidase